MRHKDKCTALLRVTQMLAAGQDVDVVDLIGNYECASFPPSLFYDPDRMYASGTKANRVKVLKEPHRC